MFRVLAAFFLGFFVTFFYFGLYRFLLIARLADMHLPALFNFNARARLGFLLRLSGDLSRHPFKEPSLPRVFAPARCPDRFLRFPVSLGAVLTDKPFSLYLDVLNLHATHP